MGFRTDFLNLEAVAALPLKLKEQNKEEYDKLTALKNAVIDVWFKNETKFLTVNGKHFKLVPLT